MVKLLRMEVEVRNISSKALSIGLLPLLLATAACNSSGGLDLASGGSVGVGDTGTSTGNGTQTAGTDGTSGANGTSGTSGTNGTNGTGTQTSSLLGSTLVTAGNATLGLGDTVSGLGNAVAGVGGGTTGAGATGLVSSVVDAAGNLVSSIGTTVASAGNASNSGAAPGLSSVVQIGAVGQSLTGDATTPGLIGLSVLSPTQNTGTLATIGLASGGNPLTAIVGPAGSTNPLTNVTSAVGTAVAPVMEAVVTPVTGIVGGVVGGGGLGGGGLPVVGSLVGSLPVVSATGGVAAGTGGSVSVTPPAQSQGVVGSLLGGLLH